MSAPPELSLVILTWNSREHLPDLFRSLDRQRFQSYETIVVDNGSSDGTPEWIQEHAPGTRLIRYSRNRGFCRGMNRGAREATGEHLLLLNADLELEPDCLASLMRVARADLPALGGVFPLVLFQDAPLFLNSFGVDWHERAHWRDGRVGLFHRPGTFQPDHVFGAIFPAVLVRREVFLQAGGFDPLFFSYDEDFDLCYRMNALGWRWYTAPDAVIRHAYRASLRSPRAVRRQQILFLRNYLAVFFKNYEWKSLRRHWRTILYRYIGAPLKHAWAERRWRDLSPPIRGLAAFLLRLPLWWPKRILIQRRRTVPDEELWSRAPIEEFNLFHYNGDLVMSLLNLRASRGEPVAYESGGQRYVTG